jgi:oligopeptide/dipeptide ABC transporter ATP-binding protein
MLSSRPILEINNLSIDFRTKDGAERKVLENFNLRLYEGQRIAVVGESGSGKTVMASSILRLLPEAHSSGEILFKGENLMVATSRRVSEIRGAEIGMTFQDPLSSLNPIMTIGDQVSEVLRIRGVSKKEASDRTVVLLQELGIEDASNRLNSYPYEFSGGMRQRVLLAMSVIASPSILIADEPTTALDVRVQAQVMATINQFTSKRNLATIFISHDLSVVAGFADYVVVMYAGRVVEEGPVDEIFYRPAHPYTRGLLDSIPSIDQSSEKRLNSIPGVTPEPGQRSSGCVFRDRCDSAQETCSTKAPELLTTGEKHLVRCHFPLLPLSTSRNMG